MAKHILTATTVRNLLKPGPGVRRASDGGGLYLVIAPSGSGKWVLRRQRNGKRQDIGLGSANSVTLAQARAKADDVSDQVTAGIDVPEQRKLERVKRAKGLEAFETVARVVQAELLPTWKNEKHGVQWISTMEAYVFPGLGRKPVEDVTGPMVRDVLAQIWLVKPETARRVRQRIGTVIDWAIAKGLREHPINMKAVTKGLPPQRDETIHHPAMPYDDLPAFLASLREMPDASPAARLALEFTILTAARSGESRLATWDEIDLDGKRWSIPGPRMKMGKPHAVPLSSRSLEILEQAAEDRRCEFVFEGAKRGRPVSDMSLTGIMHKRGLPYVPHGFRSAFRDWVSEQTGFGRDLAEMALAHKVGDATERAYARSTLLERRRELMDAWAAFCMGTADNVVRMAR